MTNAQTPHSRALRAATAAAWVKEEVARGGCRLSLVLPPDAKARLDRLTARYGTKKAAIRAALDFAEQALENSMPVNGGNEGICWGKFP